MIDIQAITTGLELREDGIWYGKDDENLSYPVEGNDSCFAVEENSFWFRHRNNCIVSVIKAFPPRDNSTIFDVGGGNGFVSLGLTDAGFNVALVEPGQTGAHNAKRRGISNVICATTNTAQFHKGALPAVGLFDVVEHIDDDLNFLKSIRELIEDKGRVYLTVPAYNFLWSAEDISAGHFRRYTLKSIENVLSNAGFQVEFSSYIFRFLPVPIFLLRSLSFRLGLSKAVSDSKKMSREHGGTGKSVRKIIDFFLGSEIAALNNKKRVSFGGTCLVVAKCLDTREF